MTARIGVIGGSGVYDFEGVEYREEVCPDTPYGKPSDSIRLGTCGGRELAFLPRHGRTHRLNPSNVPYAANIYALKTLGVEWIIALNAVGSLRMEMAPLHLVIPDQLIDRTRSRVNTLFDPIAVHVGFADPFCNSLRQVLIRAAKECDLTVHEKGTYICMEGPLFSTRAESHLYRSWGAHLIGMTALPEAKLAREAEICYAIIASVTDYDCWHEEEETVDIQMVIRNLLKNAENVKKVVLKAIPYIPQSRDGDPCASALATAVISKPQDFPPDKREAFEFLTKKYL
ncbi:MAG TPA: S-methyl-5'-thioadenosine phosphorylase [bacterium]|nr:S-methyl-5'-thioadenosine phosphorylase [bacterium]HQL62871.1 S-methyl-5'-thioadenosine phosphorylase [bacterium]